MFFHSIANRTLAQPTRLILRLCMAAKRLTIAACDTVVRQSPSIEIKAKFVSRLSDILLRRYDSIILCLEKLHSAEATATGIVHTIRRAMTRVGNNSIVPCDASLFRNASGPE